MLTRLLDNAYACIGHWTEKARVLGCSQRKEASVRFESLGERLENKILYRTWFFAWSHNNMLEIQHPDIELFKQSFEYSVFTMWNELVSDDIISMQYNEF